MRSYESFDSVYDFEDFLTGHESEYLSDYELSEIVYELRNSPSIVEIVSEHANSGYSTLAALVDTGSVSGVVNFLLTKDRYVRDSALLDIVTAFPEDEFVLRAAAANPGCNSDTITAIILLKNSEALVEYLTVGNREHSEKTLSALKEVYYARPKWASYFLLTLISGVMFGTYKYNMYEPYEFYVDEFCQSGSLDSYLTDRELGEFLTYAVQYDLEGRTTSIRTREGLTLWPFVTSHVLREIERRKKKPQDTESLLTDHYINNALFEFYKNTEDDYKKFLVYSALIDSEHASTIISSEISKGLSTNFIRMVSRDNNTFRNAELTNQLITGVTLPLLSEPYSANRNETAKNTIDRLIAYQYFNSDLIELFFKNLNNISNSFPETNDKIFLAECLVSLGCKKINIGRYENEIIEFLNKEEETRNTLNNRFALIWSSMSDTHPHPPTELMFKNMFQNCSIGELSEIIIKSSIMPSEENLTEAIDSSRLTADTDSIDTSETVAEIYMALLHHNYSPAIKHKILADAYKHDMMTYIKDYAEDDVVKSVNEVSEMIGLSLELPYFYREPVVFLGTE